MNIRVISIEQINAAAYNPRVDLPPGDPENEKQNVALKNSAMLSRLFGISVPTCRGTRTCTDCRKGQEDCPITDQISILTKFTCIFTI